MLFLKTETWGEEFWQSKSSKNPEVRMNTSIIAVIYVCSFMMQKVIKKWQIGGGKNQA